MVGPLGGEPPTSLAALVARSSHDTRTTPPSTPLRAWLSSPTRDIHARLVTFDTSSSSAPEFELGSGSERRSEGGSGLNLHGLSERGTAHSRTAYASRSECTLRSSRTYSSTNSASRDSAHSHYTRPSVSLSTTQSRKSYYPSSSVTSTAAPMAPAFLNHHYHHPRPPSSSNSYHTPTPTSTRPPSLASDHTYFPATPSESSASTGLASQFAGVPLLDVRDGVLQQDQDQHQDATAAAPPLFECTFWFLNCTYTSRSADEWRTHCSAHWLGVEPPLTLSCPLCPHTFVAPAVDAAHQTSPSGWTVWHQRLEHVEAHFREARGGMLNLKAAARRELPLHKYLWDKRLIADQDLKDLKTGRVAARAGRFTVTGSAVAGREERMGVPAARRRRAREGVGVGGRVQRVGVGW